MGRNAQGDEGRRRARSHSVAGERFGKAGALVQGGSSEHSRRLGPAFRLTGVSKSYAGRRVLGELDLAIDRGERVALIGPSGSGKTTLLRLLSGLAWPDEGRVESLGRDTSKLAGRALRELRRDVGVLLQNDNLIGGLRVAHNVLMGRLGHWSALRAFFSLISPKSTNLLVHIVLLVLHQF